MCGIAGSLSFGGADASMPLHMERMLDAIAHRGPDDHGVWADLEAGIVLGHRRLSILDLSPMGHQPMISVCGRFVIAFNGEIYNFKDLKNLVENSGWNSGWRGHSDTEVLLASIAMFGVEKTLQNCVGMFAFALWDRESKTLTMARDRMGEKPLYYGFLGGELVFASDMAAIYRHPKWNGEIDRGALALLMRHNYIPAPYSIFSNVSKLKPGHILTLSQSNSEPQISPYWSAAEHTLDGVANPFSGSADDAVNALEDILRQAISDQMIADVPLGAFLSGGIDSSTVVALMQDLSSRPVKTFTIGFNEEGYNEAKHAKAVAQHLGTEHTELYVSPEDALAVVPQLPFLYSEPFSDSSQIPTYLVSKMAREHVTVCLSGDGGDELFSGYSRYKISEDIWGKISLLPPPLRSVASKLIKTANPGLLNGALDALFKLLPAKYQIKNPGDKLIKFADLLTLSDRAAVYRKLISHWDNPTALVKGSVEPDTAITGEALEMDSFTKLMMYMDTISYLPDDILAKVDRASMGVSLESRVPMLDHRVVEFAMSLPLEISRNHGKSKWPLRQILYKYVPKEMVERPKMGFGVPLDSWLRGPLREWGEELLSKKKLESDGYFDSDIVRHAWDDHQAGRRNCQYLLWDVLSFQAWLDNYNDNILNKTNLSQRASIG